MPETDIGSANGMAGFMAGFAAAHTGRLMQRASCASDKAMTGNRDSTRIPGRGILAVIRGRRKGRSGQALIESCIVILFICLIFFGLLQVSRFFAARETLDYAAARGARARTVGFNQFMMLKAVRVSTIPSAGRMRFPHVDGGPIEQQALEEARIPLYLGALSPSHLQGILDYEEWPNIGYSYHSVGEHEIVVRTRQVIPFTFPLHRLYYAGDDLLIRGEAAMENHYPLYLESYDL